MNTRANNQYFMGINYGLWFRFMMFNATFNNILIYIVAVSFIGGGNQSIRRKPPTIFVT